MPRIPHSSLNARRPSPRRVPPDQSTTRSRPRAPPRRDRATRTPRDAREPGAECEGLDARAAHDRRVHEPHEGPRVRLHRAAHVEQQHERPRPRARRVEHRRRDLAPRSQRPADRAAQVGRAVRPRTRLAPPRRPPRTGEPQIGHEPARLARTRPAVYDAKSRLAQRLDRAPAHGDRRPQLRCRRRRRSAPASRRRTRDGRGAVRGLRSPAPAAAPAAPERVEGAVVGGDVVGTAHERRPAGPVDAGRGARPTQSSARANPIVEPTGTSMPGAAQRPANATATAVGVRIRPTSAVHDRQALAQARRARASSRPCARTRAWSSWYFRIVPSVASTDRSSSRAAPSVASDCAQSIVSATPAACRAPGRAALRPRPRRRARGVGDLGRAASG